MGAKMKKILSLILVLTMICICFSACGKTSNEPIKNPVDNNQGEMLDDSPSDPTNTSSDNSESNSKTYDVVNMTEYTIEINNKKLSLPISYEEFTKQFKFELTGLPSMNDLNPDQEYVMHGNFENLGDTMFYVRNNSDKPASLTESDVVGVMLFPNDNIDILGIKKGASPQDIENSLGKPTFSFAEPNLCFSYRMLKMNFGKRVGFVEITFDDKQTANYIRYGVFDVDYAMNIPEEGSISDNNNQSKPIEKLPEKERPETPVGEQES